MNRILIIGIIIGIGLLLSSCKKDEEFRTALKFEEPIIEAGYTKAHIRWNYSGKGTPSTFDIEYSLDASFLRYVKENVSGTGGYILTTLTSLQDGQTYYVRCRAKNDYSSITSDSYTFTTLACQPAVVHTDSVSDLTHTSARLQGTLSDWGTDVKPEVGFCYAQHEDVSIEDIYVTCGLVTTNNVSTFSFLIRNLPDSTTHYCRACARNATGIVYGEEVKFTTTPYQMPSVLTGNVTEITYTTATCGGTIIDIGGTSITERGICYSTTPNPTISNSKEQCGSGGVGSFSCYLSNLTAGTTYYVRAYATNSKGTAYGEEVSFSTSSYQPITVQTIDVTNITYTTATCGGIVIDDGGLAISEKGVCYSISPNPTIADNKVINYVSSSSFTCSLSNLTAGTTYYVRAYATNSKVTAYGEEVSFSTSSYQIPTVSTVYVTNITYTTATCGGIVINDGGQLVTERGVCYSTSPNPTISNNIVSNGSGVGSFACTISNLNSNTTYYIRAYAINNIGIGYAEQIVFKTSAQEGALRGLFSISLFEKVSFSKGNLRFQASTNTWSFADKQYDMIGAKNSKISSTYTGWIDLFYGGSGKNPLNTSYYTFVDWGVNAISNGGNIANAWRTLTAQEWDYLINKRMGATMHRGRATINNIHGYILLPDDWSAPSGITFLCDEIHWSNNDYTIDNWEKMEASGAVFLPCAGSHYGTEVSYENEMGEYWSSSYSTSGTTCKYLHFSESNCSIYEVTIQEAFSVRLIIDVE